MRKTELIKEISGKIGIEVKMVEATLGALITLVTEHLTHNETVSLNGFGTFLIIRREAKIGRNISLNTAITLPAHYAPVFKPSKQFSERVKRNVKDKVASQHS